MGRTLPSTTILFQQELQALARFRRALRREDQRALDDLLASAHLHLAEAGYAANTLPFETLLLCMLLEEHKRTLRLEAGLQACLEFLQLAQDPPALEGGPPPALPPATDELRLALSGPAQLPGDISQALDTVPGDLSQPPGVASTPDAPGELPSEWDGPRPARAAAPPAAPDEA